MEEGMGWNGGVDSLWGAVWIDGMGWIDVRMDGGVDGTDGWMGEWIDGWIDVQMIVKNAHLITA
jgi:hypothetical protein